MKQAERNAQTQQLIKEAFIHLINEKGFNSLTVSDITREAGVSRGTFYVHYTDKFELLTKIEDELIDNIAAALTANLAEPLSNHTPEDFSGAPYKVFNRHLDTLIKSVIQCALYYHQMGIPNSSTASKNWLITYLLVS